MKNLVILTGAGMSAESGISTFRDAGGLWDQYPVEQVATPEGYVANPQLVIQFQFSLSLVKTKQYPFRLCVLACLFLATFYMKRLVIVYQSD